MPRHPDWIEDLYKRLADEQGARVCKGISEEACREVPGNFFRIFASNTLTKLGDRLASPKTTIAWLLQALGAPAIITGLVVPIRESGSLIPQMFLAGFIRRLAIRKWTWVLGALFQALAIAGIGVVAQTLDGATAGWAIVSLVVLFSLARGLSSIASKDVLGKTIPKTRRGRLNGLMSAVSGLLVLAAGIGLIVGDPGGEGLASTDSYAFYLLIAAGLWAIAAVIYSLVVEFPGETDGGAGPRALERLGLLRRDPAFRRFVIIRALAIGSGLSAPFVITLAHRQLGGAALWLGVFIVVDGLAGMVSGPVWGRWADHSSRRVLIAAMALTGLLLLTVVVAGQLAFSAVATRILFPVIFFLLGIAHSGVRLGRKTYLVDMAEGNQRTDYVAVSNTVIGVILLAAGALTGAIALLSVPVALGVFAACSVAGALLARSLPELS